ENRPVRFAHKPAPTIWMLVGLQGSGKTTSVAKLARWLKEKEKKSVLVASCDVYRPAATNQLEILAAWQPWLQTVELLHKQTGRDILFTEIGYRSIDGAGMKPYQFNNPGTVDLQEQADLYWAALQSTVDIPWLKGMYWWNWRADGSGGEANRDYTPFGKPAESVLTKSWNRE
ncbi:hypothetical protein IH824_05075, partial [candidate division KSB1 bacterium]|nr:hypothetical protein [candidate division KSB1 bacterium]